jgi:hypothetical protein
MHNVQYVVLKGESGKNWMCVELILQNKVGVGNGRKTTCSGSNDCARQNTNPNGHN